jgi:hypothetical protein
MVFCGLPCLLYGSTETLFIENVSYYRSLHALGSFVFCVLPYIVGCCSVFIIFEWSHFVLLFVAILVPKLQTQALALPFVFQIPSEM